MADVGDGMTFSMKQVLSISGICIAVAGSGGALSVRADDAEQNEKLAVHSSEISVLKESASDLREDLTETRDAVIVMGPQVEAIEEDVTDIKRDIKEILRAVAEGGG
jgi:hypothetical protein